MAESFLEEQLERIRRLTERMTQFQNRSAELTQELARDRQSAARQNPLHEVRDYRVLGQDSRPISRQHRASAADRPARRRRRK